MKHKRVKPTKFIIRDLLGGDGKKRTLYADERLVLGDGRNTYVSIYAEDDAWIIEQGQPVISFDSAAREWFKRSGP